MADPALHHAGVRGGVPAVLLACGVAAVGVAVLRAETRAPVRGAPEVAAVTVAAPSMAPRALARPVLPVVVSQAPRVQPACGRAAVGSPTGAAAAEARATTWRAQAADLLDARSRADAAQQAAALLVGASLRPEQRRDRIERLAGLATSHADARIYAMAEEGCKDLLDDWASACHLIAAAQWAQLEPDNAVPWLLVAERARAQGDAATEDDAMYRASHAARSDSRADVVKGLVDQMLAQASIAPPLRETALAAGWQAQADWSWWSTAQALHYCVADDRVLADPDRAATCDRLAGIQARSTSSPVELATAHAIGRRLRWAQGRLDGLRFQAGWAAEAVRRQRAALEPDCGDAGVRAS